MHPFLNLFPAALCLVGAGLTTIAMLADIRAGSLNVRDKEAAIGNAIILACVGGAAISGAAAFGGIG
jgi:hypothetical protein